MIKLQNQNNKFKKNYQKYEKNTFTLGCISNHN